MTQGSSPLAVLSHGPFRMIWLATMVSMLGHWIQTVAAAWTMSSITDSAILVALVQSTIHLPLMIFSYSAGIIADTSDRRLVMLSAQLLACGSAATLATLTWLDLISPVTLLIPCFLIGTSMALHHPAWNASLVDILGSGERLPAAISLNSMGTNSMRSIGPAIGGAVVTFAGAAVAFALNAVSYLFLIAALYRWKPPTKGKGLPSEEFRIAATNGLRYLLMSPNLLRVIFYGSVFGLSAVCTTALLPLIVRNDLQQPASIYGIMLACFGVGAVIAAFLLPWIRTRYPIRHIVRAALCATGFAQLAIVMVDRIDVTGLSLVVSGAAWSIFLNLLNITVQTLTPRWVIGRALSLHMTFTVGSMAVGALVWGYVAQIGSNDLAMICAAALALFSVMIGVRLHDTNADAQRFEPSNRFVPPQVDQDIKSMSGPIVVYIDYKIENSDISAFLEIMTQRRRMHLRDGSYNWALLRDLETANRWTERYYMPTWTEYLRHHERRTKEDGRMHDMLEKLSKAQPKVRRMIERQTVPTKINPADFFQ